MLITDFGSESINNADSAHARRKIGQDGRKCFAIVEASTLQKIGVAESNSIVSLSASLASAVGSQPVRSSFMIFLNSLAYSQLHCCRYIPVIVSDRNGVRGRRRRAEDYRRLSSDCVDKCLHSCTSCAYSQKIYILNVCSIAKPHAFKQI